MSASKFEISVPDAAIEELQGKLRQCRLHKPLEGAGWDYGMDSKVMRNLVDYWANEFDWRKQVSRLFPPSCQCIAAI